MGRIVKYNKEKGGKGRVMSYNSTSSNNGYPTNDSITSEQSANLWGNDFHGYEDLNSSIFVMGDITIDWDEEDEDSMYDEEDYDELPSGSLYVKNKVEAKSVYGKSIFLDYPELDNKKTNLLDLLKDHDSRISTNTSNILNLTKRVDNCESRLTSVENTVSTHTTQIKNIGDRITDVENHQKDQDVMINANVGEIIGIKSDIGRLERKIDDIEIGDCNCTGGGTIVGNGITTIDGNVNWKQMSRNDNFNSGFIFENLEGTVEFSPMNLYESYDFEDGGLPRRYASYSAIVQCLWDWDLNTSEGTFYGVGYAQPIGYFNVGDVISVNTMQGRVIDWVDKTYDCQVTHIGYSISCNGLNITGKSGVVAFNHTCNMAGLYRIQFSVYGTHNKPRNSTIFQQDETICEITANYSLPDKDSTGQISPNGIAYSYNNNRNYVYLGPDCTMLKYGNYGLKIDSSGIWRYNGTSWVRATI